MSFLIRLVSLIIKNVQYVGTGVKCYFIYVWIFLLMHFASRICQSFFFLIIFIYNYGIICENLPYNRRHKLVSTIIMFYN